MPPTSSLAAAPAGSKARFSSETKLPDKWPGKQKDAPAMEHRPCTIVTPPDRNIPVEFAEIFAIVKGSMTITARQQFEEVCMLMESLYSQEFMLLRRDLKHNFLPFSVGAKGQNLQTRVGKPLPPKADLDMREQKLILDIIQVMGAARFNILTRDEWDLALAESFMFDLPVAVNWDYFDNRLLCKFWASTAERRRLRQALPDCADRVLVFHRGVGVAEDSGMYINRKINMLVDYLVVGPARFAGAWLSDHVLGKRRLAQKIGPSHRESVAMGRTPAVPTQQHEVTVKGRKQRAPVAYDEDGKPVHRNAKVVERRSLAQLMPTAWTVIMNFFTTVRLQEPMFKEVVVLYRTSTKARQNKAKGDLPLHKRTATERLHNILARRNINIKHFHDIPMADMEAIFPDKKVYVHTVSFINLLVQAFTAFFAAIATLWRAGSLDLHSIWSAMSLVAARTGQLYSSMQSERTRIMQEMTNILYDKTNDSQEGVLSMLMEGMADQQLKEAVIAYSILYMNIEEELTQEALDELCEDFLEEHFDLRIDFAVEDALPRLIKWGLVKRNPKSGKYRAVPTAEARAKLVEFWGGVYHALSKPPLVQPVPLAQLLPGGETELEKTLRRLAQENPGSLEAIRRAQEEEEAAARNGGIDGPAFVVAGAQEEGGRPGNPGAGTGGGPGTWLVRPAPATPPPLDRSDRAGSGGSNTSPKAASTPPGSPVTISSTMIIKPARSASAPLTVSPAAPPSGPMGSSAPPLDTTSAASSSDKKKKKGGLHLSSLLRRNKKHKEEGSEAGSPTKRSL